MANERISDLPGATVPLVGTELVEISWYNGSGYTSKSVPTAHLATGSFASANQTIDGSTTSYKVAHGLGRVPTCVWAELVCISADANSAMAVGDCMDISSLIDPATGNFVPNGLFCDATYVEVAFFQALLGSETAFWLIPRGGGSKRNVSSFGNFAIVLHAS